MFFPDLDQYIDNPTPENSSMLYESLETLMFNIHDLDISSRVFTHWRHHGLIPFMEDGTWVRLNIFQLLWVMIIEDLRAMGIPIKKIKQIRDQLFEPISLSANEMFTKDGKLKGEYTKGAAIYGTTKPEEIIAELERRWAEEPEVLETFVEHFKPPIFIFIMLNVLYRNMDHTVFVGTDETVELSADQVSEFSVGPIYTFDELLAKYQDEPVLILPLRKYLYKLITTEKFETRIHGMQLLNDVEGEVIRIMRDGNLRELRIIFDPDKSHTDLVYTHSSIGDQATLNKLIDKFKDKKHVQLVVKSNDGKTVHYEYQNRKRFAREK